jgi:hypothetical protein
MKALFLGHFAATVGPRILPRAVAARSMTSSFPQTIRPGGVDAVAEQRGLVKAAVPIDPFQVRIHRQAFPNRTNRSVSMIRMIRQRFAVRLVADRFKTKTGARKFGSLQAEGYAQIKAAVEKSRVKAGPTSYSPE